MKTFVIIDGNMSWVRSLVEVLPETRAFLFRSYAPSFYQRDPAPLIRGFFGWSKQDERISERFIVVPGWTRFFRLSTAAVIHACRRLINRIGNPYAIVYTLPQYAGIAERMKGQFNLYYAYDPYRFYDWNQEQIGRLEQRMLNCCDASFAISKKLQQDFQKLTSRPVFYSPNAVSPDFVDRLSRDSALPPDMAGIPRPIVACIGQINNTYDWNLIDSLAERLPGISFVFIGKIFDEPPEIRRRIDQTLARSNVHWLGAKPHGELPAYLRAADILFNPLVAGEQNDRRSPLRLYDYLATDKPILSTPVAEAFEHDGLIEIGKDLNECVEILRRPPASGVDASNRSALRGEYILKNTWPARARQFMETVQSLRAQAVAAGQRLLI
jgi:glycosyltransferase involved in cell wall biosynthesis